MVVGACSGGVTAAASADNYVALGDSYSSGTGTRDYSLNSGCQRGPYAYPALIKADRRLLEHPLLAAEVAALVADERAEYLDKA